MQKSTLRSRWLIGLMVVGLVAGGFQLQSRWRQAETVRAQGDDDNDNLSAGELAILLLAVSNGQKVRLSVGTVPGAREVPYFGFFTMHNANNDVIYRSPQIDVPIGEWRFADVSREALNITGEPGTGLAQVMVRVSVVDLRGNRPSSDFTGSMTVLNATTGESSAYHMFAFKKILTTNAQH